MEKFLYYIFDIHGEVNFFLYEKTGVERVADNLETLVNVFISYYEKKGSEGNSYK